MRDRIEIDGLQLDCVIGVLPEERDREQPLCVDVRLDLDLARAGRSGRIADTVDYARLVRELRAMLRFRRYKLLENAAEECAAMLLGVHPSVAALSLRLVKPKAIAGARAAGIAIERSQADVERRIEPSRFGRVEVLLESREAGLYLLHVAPRHRIALHHHRVMRELEWLVDGELFHVGSGGIEQGPIVPASPIPWEYGQVHGYENRSDEDATLFCCDTPPFIPADEIVRDEVVG